MPDALRPTHPGPNFVASGRAWMARGSFASTRLGSTVGQPIAPFGRTIVVPFAPETKASGILETEFFQACWYRKAFTPPAPPPGGRVISSLRGSRLPGHGVGGRGARRHP